MTIDRKSTVWICKDCGYQLSADEFEDNYVLGSVIIVMNI